MREFEAAFSIENTYPFRLLGDPGKLVYIDIETTGLSSHTSSLYLIGAVFFRDGQAYYHQWFVDRLSEEQTVLRAFERFIAPYETLVHFNGDSFDIPFLLDLYRSYHLTSSLSVKNSVDLLKITRKLKNILRLDSYRQKAVESFLGITREDRFSGGELIPVYEEYLRSGKQELLNLLLCHNREDLTGMPRFSGILSYYDALLSDEPEMISFSHTVSDGHLVLNAVYPYRFPKALSFTELPSGIRVYISGSEISASIPVTEETLRYYLPNPTCYYYLIKEDMVVHKKIASSVDPKYRAQATKENCYLKHESRFLPALGLKGLKSFGRDYPGRNEYVLLKDVPMECYLNEIKNLLLKTRK